MIVAIVGSRKWVGHARIEARLKRLALEEFRNASFWSHVTVISGGASGVDTMAIKIAQALRFPTKEYPADWESFGKSAGYRRNEEMVKAADLVIAFWDGESKGTKHSIDLAMKYRKSLEIYFS